MQGISFSHEHVMLLIIIFLLAAQILSGINFDSNPGYFWMSTTIWIFQRWVMLVLLLLIMGYFAQFLKLFNNTLLLYWISITPFILLLVQLSFRKLFFRFFAQQNTLDKAIIVGINELSLKLAGSLAQHSLYGVQCIGFFDDRTLNRLPGGLTLLGGLKDVHRFISKEQVKIIYISLPIAEQQRIHALLDDLRDTTASIYYMPDVSMIDIIQARSFDIEGIPMVTLCESPFTGSKALIKRVSDIVLALLILLLISPLLVLIAIGVKRSSPGPIIFKQRRYGLDGEEISVYKFRSMTVCENDAQIVQATRNDARITPLGAFLRKKSLDELPQFINVLQGRMSIVGPRPHAVAHNELYRKQIKGYMIRHKVRPGITGWAQVNGCRGETETVAKMQRRIEYDLNYLRHWSLGMDLLIILRTIGIVIKDENAY
ncbi:MAG: undecaprenyl-phosphate glucose phosphotransferase [Methylococcaceae bacterium]|nr:undecaprenyl-phosphate glucose phosphotransferase [Methylococcaceae bacterium]